MMHSCLNLQHHFFVVLRKMLQGRPEVSELHSIEGAKVPLMRFRFNGVLVDFPYVQLPVINAAEVSLVVFYLLFAYHIVSVCVAFAHVMDIFVLRFKFLFPKSSLDLAIHLHNASYLSCYSLISYF
jgi:hypothetical protein